MALTRRGFIRAGAAAGALLVASPQRVFGRAPASFAAGRQSRLFPGNGTFVVHSDLHNHTLFSDGATAAADAFAQMRDVGLDVAAITDHAILGKVTGHVCASQPCTLYGGINDDHWEQLGTISDAKNEDGSFVAMRGFEWSTGTIGHMNVWFTEKWIDTLVTAAQSPKGLEQLFAQMGEAGAPLAAVVNPLLDELPETATMDLFYEWLQSEPDAALLGGGADGLAGFNHPNLYGDFQGFKFVEGLVERMVSCEALNGKDDYLFWGMDEGQTSPINACLNAGWKVGMLGVSDEHFDDWSDGKARAGVWVKELSRAGVREALLARRFFATYERGLRLDATANGVQMGSDVPHTKGPLRVELDIDRGPEWFGKRLNVQVLRPGEDRPVLALARDVTLPSSSTPVIHLTVNVDIEDGKWVLLRVTDPSVAAEERTPAEFKSFGRAVAYASPFFLVPGASSAAPAAPVAPPKGSVAGAGEGQLPATGGGAAATGATGAAAAAALAAMAARRLNAATSPHDHSR